MRNKISLNGMWRFTPEKEYRVGQRHNLDEYDIPVHAHPDMNRRYWDVVPVPGVWQRYAEKYSIYEGACWYCREFTLTGVGEQTRAILRFGGVSTRADVYVNGKSVGWHDTGYTEFVLDVTGVVHNGVNFIAVLADNRTAVTLWPNNRGYLNYGGIHRDVTLELMDETYVDDLTVTPRYDDADKCGVLALTGRVCGDATTPVKVQAAGETCEISAAADGSFAGELRLPQAKAWTPEEPTLYDAVVTVGNETVWTGKVGFKTMERRGSHVYLNGQPYYLKGACYVYDSPVYGLVMTEDQLRLDLGEMKEAGCNAVRTHYPMDDRFYAICDELGILVWTEITVYCYHPETEATGTFFSSPAHIAAARRQAVEMIATARSHVSVAVYGIGNECNVPNKEAEAFFIDIATLVKQTEPTRMVGYAAVYAIVGNIGGLVDIMGVNSYHGWYDKIGDVYGPTEQKAVDGKVLVETAPMEGFHAMMEDVEANTPEDLPLLLTEFGADSLEGNFSASHDPWSEEYHADVIESVLEASKSHPRVNGTFVFCFTDYYDPSKPMNGYWNECNLKGMLTYRRNRRLAFYALQKAYQG